MSTDAAYYRKVLPAPRQLPGRPKTKKITWAEHHGDVKAKALHPLPGFRTTRFLLIEILRVSNQAENTITVALTVR